MDRLSVTGKSKMEIFEGFVPRCGVCGAELDGENMSTSHCIRCGEIKCDNCDEGEDLCRDCIEAEFE